MTISVSLVYCCSLPLVRWRLTTQEVVNCLSRSKVFLALSLWLPAGSYLIFVNGPNKPNCAQLKKTIYDRYINWPVHQMVREVLGSNRFYSFAKFYYQTLKKLLQHHIITKTSTVTKNVFILDDPHVDSETTFKLQTERLRFEPRSNPRSSHYDAAALTTFQQSCLGQHTDTFSVTFTRRGR